MKNLRPSLELITYSDLYTKYKAKMRKNSHIFKVKQIFTHTHTCDFLYRTSATMCMCMNIHTYVCMYANTKRSEC